MRGLSPHERGFVRGLSPHEVRLSPHEVQPEDEAEGARGWAGGPLPPRSPRERRPRYEKARIARQGHSCWVPASSNARRTALAFALDSSNSYSGFASATVPPPAWTCALPSFIVTVRM